MLNLLPAVMTDLVYPVHKALNCIGIVGWWWDRVVIDVMISISFFPNTELQTTMHSSELVATSKKEILNSVHILFDCGLNGWLLAA